MKSEIFKAQKEGAGQSTDQVNVGQNEEAGEQAPKAPEQVAEVAAVEAEAPQVASFEQKVPEAATIGAVPAQASATEADEAEIQEALKMVQSYLDSAGFIDKTAEELLADGQLGQLALQLGINIPEGLQ